jgi:hypothetical protein
LDFGQVGKGDTPVKHITVHNTGTGNLMISGLIFQASSYFSVIFDTQKYQPGNVTIAFSDAVAVLPGKFVIFSVSFDPESAQSASGTLTFLTNDLNQPLGTTVTMKGNEAKPCILVYPKNVQFGGKVVGSKSVMNISINNCGTLPLTVTNIELLEGSDPDFTEGWSTAFNGQPISNKNPMIIPADKKASVDIEYTPSKVGPVQTASILFESNAPESAVEINVTGKGVQQACPTAVGVIQEGQEVIPQTVLHLYGDQSFAPIGSIGGWKWSVSQPANSLETIVPSDTFPNPVFEANSAGNYTFKLTVWDDKGVESCMPWVQHVAVIPDETIHVELSWVTPNDPDESDEGPEAGSDLDLHFVHNIYAKSGPDLDKDGQPDPWFDKPFDCFWFNAHPNWGSFDPTVDDDPGLDRDDTDGAGPENVNLNIPEHDTTYRLGVHYWSDHEYGPAYATLRVYILGKLEFEESGIKMVNHDMWDAATIHWPTAEVSLFLDETGNYKITPDYQNPFFFQP